MNQTEADSTPKDSDKPLGFMGFIGCMGLLAFSVCLAVIGSILNGWALSVPWGWFVVPTFNLPDLGIVHAFGLSMVINLFFVPPYSDSEYKKKISDSVVRALGYVVLSPFISVSPGWIVHHFM